MEDEGERFQILQHAYVYDLETVVLAISDNMSSLIHSTIVDFTTELKEDFGKVLKMLKEFSLDWAYPDQEPNTHANNHQSKPPKFYRSLKHQNYQWKGNFAGHC